MVDYVNTVKSHLVPLLNTSHGSVQDIDQELNYVAKVLCCITCYFTSLTLIEKVMYILSATNCKILGKRLCQLLNL